MKVSKFSSSEEIFNYLRASLPNMEQRERIVLSFPFGSKLTRIEFYCGETTRPMGSAFGSMLSGETFDGPLSISVFNDYTNKPQTKSSYTYVNDCIPYLKKISTVSFEIIEKP